MNDMRMGSLFDGSAGFPLAAVMNGITAVWASEVEPYPIRVTTKRLPFMKHYGDISRMNGAEVEPVDIITGGSPCQDMSVAGKRAGLDGERSGLFREQIRIIKEMREASDGKYPRFMVWENVPGALSSNKGADFKCVLEETARIKVPGFDVPMPYKGKWGTAGLIVDEEGGFSIGWRILDAQYWGVPQRRRRIFLVADFGGTSSEEILFKREGLSWHFKESREAWQTATRGFTQGTDEAGGDSYGVVSKGNGECFLTEEKHMSLSCGGGQAGQGYGAVMASEIPIYSIDREAMSAGYEFDRKPGIDESETAYTLKAAGPGGVAHPANYLFENHSQDTRYTGPLDVAQTVSATYGMGGNNQPFVVEDMQCFDVRFTSEGTKNVRANVYETTTARTIDTGGNAPDSNQGGVAVLCMATQQGGAEIAENLSPTITAAAGMSGNNQPVLCVSRTHGISVSEDVVQTIQAAAGESGNNQPMICEPVPNGVAYSLQGNMIGRSDENGPQGSGVNEDVSFTLNATDQHGVVYSIDRESYNCGQNFARNLGISDEGVNATLKASGPDAVALPSTYCSSKASFFTRADEEIANTLVATDYKDAPIINDNDGLNYIVRRLMPLECARLQGFPDWWTANLGTKEEDITEEMMEFWREVFETHRKVITGASKPKTDKQIKKWLVNPDSDSAEYKMWGNGVALPCVLYVMEGISQILKGENSCDEE